MGIAVKYQLWIKTLTLYFIAVPFSFFGNLNFGEPFIIVNNSMRIEIAGVVI